MMLFVVTGFLKTDVFIGNSSGNILVQRKSRDFYHSKGANNLDQPGLK